MLVRVNRRPVTSKAVARLRSSVVVPRGVMTHPECELRPPAMQPTDTTAESAPEIDRIRCDQFLGGLLRHYERDAA